jgi:hypothetical protein
MGSAGFFFATQGTFFQRSDVVVVDEAGQNLAYFVRLGRGSGSSPTICPTLHSV